MFAASIWNCVAVAITLHIWFEAFSSGSMKLDAMTEIWLIAGVLNKSLPLFAVALIVAIVQSARRKVPGWAPVLLAVLFAASLAPVFVFWQMLVWDHAPRLDLWQTHIWWCI